MAPSVSAINYRLKGEVSITLHFNPLHSIANQELFKKHLCNQSSHYENYRQFSLQREATCATAKLTPFTVSEDEWDTKEDTGKSMKNALYILQYSKRHV